MQPREAGSQPGALGVTASEWAGEARPGSVPGKARAASEEGSEQRVTGTTGFKGDSKGRGEAGGEKEQGGSQVDLPGTRLLRGQVSPRPHPALWSGKAVGDSS